MTTKRIRCSCGRVYDPVKRPACPDCGAPHVVATPTLEPKKESDERKERTVEPLPPKPTPLPFPPRWIAIGSGAVILLVMVILLSRCGSKEKPPSKHKNVVAPSPSATPSLTPAPTSAPTATAIPTATASAYSATPPPGGQQFVPGLTTDLAAMIANADPGATIKVPPGMYPGGLVLTKAVRIVGTTGQVFIQSEGRECLSVRTTGVAVQNVQFMCNGIGDLPAISVTENAELDLDGCKIQSNTGVAVKVGANAGIKALGSGFTATNGIAMHLNQQARGSFTQSSFNESKVALMIWNNSTVELRSCAFDRNGGTDAKGGTIAVHGAKSTSTLR